MEFCFFCENPPFLSFFFFFILLYIVSYCFIFRNWSPKHRSEASSCFISLAHGTPVVIMAIYAISTHAKQRRFASPNTKAQNTVLEYSIAYFLSDLLHYALFHPNDVVFICHHLATLYVLATCRYLVYHGGLEILVILVLAEVTSACQNTWSIARFKISDMSAAKTLFDFLSPCFYAFYSIVRGILGPIFVHRMWVYYASGEADNGVPRWARISWMIVIVVAIFVSIMWISNLWKELYRNRSSKDAKPGKITRR